MAPAQHLRRRPVIGERFPRRHDRRTAVDLELRNVGGAVLCCRRLLQPRAFGRVEITGHTLVHGPVARRTERRRDGCGAAGNRRARRRSRARMHAGMRRRRPHPDLGFQPMQLFRERRPLRLAAPPGLKRDETAEQRQPRHARKAEREPELDMQGHDHSRHHQSHAHHDPRIDGRGSRCLARGGDAFSVVRHKVATCQRFESLVSRIVGSWAREQFGGRSFHQLSTAPAAGTGDAWLPGTKIYEPKSPFSSVVKLPREPKV